LFKGLVGTHFNAETHAQHLGLKGGEGIQDFLDHIAHGTVQGEFGWRFGAGVLDEVAQVGIIVITNGGFHGNGLFGDLEDLANLVLGHVHLDRQRGRIRLDARFLQNLAVDAVHLVDGFYHVNRNADGACLVGNGTRNGLTNPPCRIGRKLVATTVFKLVDCLHEPDIAFLDQIQELQAPVGVLLGDGNDQPQVGFGHFALGLASTGLAGGHALVDGLEVLEGQNDATLEINEVLLDFLDVGDVALERLGIGMPACDLIEYPVEIGFIAWKRLDEMAARHAGTIDADIQRRALELADFGHLLAHAVGQLFDHFGGKAYAHELVEYDFLGLDVIR